MGYYNNLSIDTRTCGQADEDAMLDKQDKIVERLQKMETWRRLLVNADTEIMALRAQLTDLTTAAEAAYAVLTEDEQRR